MAVYLHKQSISVIQRAMHVKTDVRFDIKLKVKESDSHKIPKQIKKKNSQTSLCVWWPLTVNANAAGYH